MKVIANPNKCSYSLRFKETFCKPKKYSSLLILETTSFKSK